MKVKILVAGKYNGENLRSVSCEVGDVLETKEWYAEKLIAGGLAVAEPETQPDKVAEAKAKIKAIVKKATNQPKPKQTPKVAPVDKNVFLE